MTSTEANSFVLGALASCCCRSGPPLGPGQLILRLPSEERAKLQTLKPEDLQNIRRDELQWMVMDNAYCQQKEYKATLLAFDQMLECKQIRPIAKRT